MKKLFTSALFFSSFGVVMAQSQMPVQSSQQFMKLIWNSHFPNLHAPIAAVRSLSSVADTLQHCGSCYVPIGQCTSDMDTTQNDIYACNKGNTGQEDDCAPLVPRCAGSSERRTCKPVCKKILPFTAKAVKISDAPSCPANGNYSVEVAFEISGGKSPYRTTINRITFFNIKSPFVTGLSVPSIPQPPQSIVITFYDSANKSATVTVAVPTCKKVDQCSDFTHLGEKRCNEALNKSCEWIPPKVWLDEINGKCVKK